MISETLEGYGIKLRRLTADKIEMVRCWRNDPKISQYMVYREYITDEQQKQWFNNINNDCNLYYIIEVYGDPIGLVNIKDINNSSGEIGIFIYDDTFLHANVSKKAYKILISYAFNVIQLESLIAHIIMDNPRSVYFHKNYGFKKENIDIRSGIQVYSLKKEDFEKSKYYTLMVEEL